jgi:hypothetical protein
MSGCDATYNGFGCPHCDDPEPLQCQRDAGHEPPHRYREPAQKYSGAEVIEWADETWWTPS